MTSAQYIAFLETVFCNFVRHSGDGSLHFVCMDWRHMSELLQAAKAQYSELKNLCVWNKMSGGLGSLYRSQHELVFVFKRGSAPHINNVKLGRHGRNRTNVWDYPGVNRLKPSRLAELAMHPTGKPVLMVLMRSRTAQIEAASCSTRSSAAVQPSSPPSRLVGAAMESNSIRVMSISPCSE